jgi:hypothetical protein
VPVDENNHALAALRYLVSKLDERALGRGERTASQSDASPTLPPPTPRWLRLSNEALWRRW